MLRGEVRWGNLKQRAGAISSEDMRAVERAIRVQLDLSDMV